MKLWFDTDPGVDDALALALILARPELELVGLSTVFGNVSVAQTTHNALRLLAFMDAPDVPVHAGAAGPVQGAARFAPEVHGGDGLGGCGADLPAPLAAPAAASAVEALIEASHRHAGALHLCAVGPLTNVALALRADPSVTERLASLTVMGGAFGLQGWAGNVTPCAEANVHNDPRAAAEVLAAAWHTLRLVGLDATHSVCIPVAHLAPLQQAGPVANFLWRCVQPYAGYYRTRTGQAALVAHDATAVAALLQPSLFTWRRGPLRVVEGGLAHGQTLQDWEGLAKSDPDWQQLPHHEVAIATDAESLTQLCLQAWAQS
jgi:purine nucleosidase